jgi:hypothetical protein
VHATAPAESEYLPDIHAIHATEPAESEYLPVGHTAHPKSPFEYDPATHISSPLTDISGPHTANNTKSFNVFLIVINYIHMKSLYT